MNLLELCGVAFLVCVAILILVAIWLQITGGLSLFDDSPAEDDVDQLVLASDTAAATRPPARADISQNIYIKRQS